MTGMGSAVSRSNRGGPSTAYGAIPIDALVQGSFMNHFETFRAHAEGAAGWRGLPRFVEQEVRDFMRCAVWPAAGSAIRSKQNRIPGAAR
jgi:hypothetical protein